MLIPLIFITIASGLLVYSFLSKVLSWLTVSVAILFYTQGARGLLIHIRRKPNSRSQFVLTPGVTGLIAGGYLVSALVSLASWMNGEGWIGILAAGVAIMSGIVWLVVAQRLGSAD